MISVEFLSYESKKTIIFVQPVPKAFSGFVAYKQTSIKETQPKNNGIV